MAMLWNSSLESPVDHSHGVEGDERIPTKRFRALKNSTVRAVFALLEAYLNGIAVDTLGDETVATLTDAQRRQLEEGDGARFVPFKQKLLEYPKIALRADQRPIDVDYLPLQRILNEQLREQIYFEIELDALS